MEGCILAKCRTFAAKLLSLRGDESPMNKNRLAPSKGLLLFYVFVVSSTKAPGSMGFLKFEVTNSGRIASMMLETRS